MEDGERIGSFTTVIRIISVSTTSLSLSLLSRLAKHVNARVRCRRASSHK